MTITLPEEVERQLTPSEATLHLAIGLFMDKRLTLGKAAAVACLSQSQFLSELGKRRISLHYDLDDARADIAAVAAMPKP